MTRDAGMMARPLTAAAPLEYYAPSARAARPMLRVKRSFADRYFAFLCICLLGYALGGRGFAYLGLNPLFIGEIMLIVGCFVLLKSGTINKLLGIRWFIPVFMFMGWGAACTIPYLDKYQKDAIRDAVIWGYGTYAFIIAGLLIQDPTRVQKLILYYRKFVIAFLLLGPVVSVLCSFFEASLPTLPGTGVPIIQVKGGDMCVHLGGSFAYIVALGSNMNPWIPAIFMPINLGLNLQGRAGMVSFFVACFMTMVLRPFHPRAMRIFFVLGLAMFFLWASDIRVEKGARELSFEQVIKGFSSIVSESDDTALSGSKEWRMKWWTDIVNYTVHGKYFWMGKGFGVNLASDDGYSVDAEESLRSPHNGHMTMLARTGVPGFGIWVLLQMTWALMIVRAYFRARSRKHMNWSGMFMFIGAYWAAFMANTTFDVFLEGPMGGIWFWCIYGAGIGCVYVYRRHPELLTPARKPPTAYRPPPALPITQ
ncbi:MAG TPA: O-antigen ligase family protein [Tepidisphaeraceae bacterium]